MKKNGILLNFGRDPLLLQLARVMKLSFAIILFSCLHVYAGGFGQTRISVDFQSTQLKKALSYIEKKSSFRFLYNENLVINAPRITLTMNDAEVTEILNRIFDKSGLSYQVMANNLVVLKTNGTRVRADITVSGRVTSTTGEAIVDATVLVKGTSNGTATDSNGNYTINAPDTGTLVFSSVGFETQEVKISNRTTIDVSLKSGGASLEQVVVIGYGTSNRRDLTGSVGVVSPEDLNKRMAANPMQALQGNAPGVQVVTNGAPGGSPTVRIRGVGSLINSNPLYVVDGMFTDNIDFLNTNDIGEMTVLKDASAAAIYGVRAANGVVIITTKKGKYNQKTRVTYNGYFGVQKPTGNFDLANGQQYAAVQLAKRTANDSSRVTSSVAKFGGSGLNPSTNTDWYDELLKPSAIMHNHSIDLSGGSNKVNYTVGLNYFFQDGVTEAESNYKRYNIRVQVEAKPYEWMKLGFNTHFTNNDQRNPNRGAFALAYFASPLYPVMDPNNALATPIKYASSTSLGYNNGIFNNPVAAANYWFDRSKFWQILPTVYAEADIVKNKLSVRTQLSQRYGSGLNQNYLPQYVVDGTQRQTTSTLTTTEDRTENYIWDNLITYRDAIGDHHWTVLAGHSIREERFRSTQVITDSVPEQQEFWYADQGKRRIDGYNEIGARNGSVSFFGRLNYDFAGKYILTATFRADGSSKYQTKWGYFPSVGAGWVISEESFMKNQSLFNSLKLRGSYGKLGNDAINPNTGYAQVKAGNEFSGIFPTNSGGSGTYVPGYRLNTIFGNLDWEEVTEWNGGIDFGMLNNKLTGSVDYYHRQTKRLVFERTLPFTSDRKLIGNWGTVNNSGIEVVLNWRDKVGELGYSVGGNFSTLKNEVVDLMGLAYIAGGVSEFPTRSSIGEPFNYFFGYEVTGIYQNQAEVDNDPVTVGQNVRPGYFKYKDQNGDKRLDDADRVNIGNYLPKAYYGFNVNLDWKNFDLGIFFQGVGGAKILNNNRSFRLKFPDINGDEELMTNLWTGENSTNKYPSAYALTQGWNNFASSFFVENASYLRLQNIQLGYNFKIGNNSPASFRVYATADRPAIWTRYSGVTPEVAAPSQLPKDRSAIPSSTPASFISATGYDENVYPTTAVYTIGVRITY